MRNWKVLFMLVTVILITETVHADRVKDVAQVVGARSNQLVGYGIVVGLDRTGDGPQSSFTLQSIAAMLRRLGVLVDPGSFKLKNAAAVIVTANIPPFMKPGQSLDVVVSSLGDAKSLRGGTLVQTPLRGADRQIYAVAQGQVSIGGFSAGGAGASRVVNHPTVGRIPGGAVVEKEIVTRFEENNTIQLALHAADSVTAIRMVESINQELDGDYASATNPGLVTVRIPDGYQGRTVEMLSRVTSVRVQRDVPARVIINERTGTVVVGSEVTLLPVAVAHGGITVEVRRNVEISQPMPLSAGRTVVSSQPELDAHMIPGDLHYVPGSATVSDLVSALNALGVKPNDLIVIFQALASSGALTASVEVQ